MLHGSVSPCAHTVALDWDPAGSSDKAGRARCGGECKVPLIMSIGRTLEDEKV